MRIEIKKFSLASYPMSYDMKYDMKIRVKTYIEENRY